MASVVKGGQVAARVYGGCRLPGCFCALVRLIRPSVRHSRRATRGKGTDQASLASDLAITIFSAQTLTALIRRFRFRSNLHAIDSLRDPTS